MLNDCAFYFTGNENALVVVDDAGEEAEINDELYEKIVIADERGGYIEQRDGWREGAGFAFATEFLAKKDEEAEEAATAAESEDEGEGEAEAIDVTPEKED
jgi:hypothetical protein